MTSKSTGSSWLVIQGDLPKLVQTTTMTYTILELNSISLSGSFLLTIFFLYHFFILFHYFSLRWLVFRAAWNWNWIFQLTKFMTDYRIPFLFTHHRLIYTWNLSCRKSDRLFFSTFFIRKKKNGHKIGSGVRPPRVSAPSGTLTEIRMECGRR